MGRYFVWPFTACMVSCGVDWTDHVDYTKGHSISIGDGAGSAIVGRHAPWSFIDYATETLGNIYGAMTMKTREPADHPQQKKALYAIEPEAGIESYKKEGMEGPLRLINQLIKRNNVPAPAIALFTHQASRKLLNHWNEQLKPGHLYDTLNVYGNMTFATIPVNLSHYWDEIQEEYLVLHTLGVGFHQTAILLRRVS